MAKNINVEMKSDEVFGFHIANGNPKDIEGGEEIISEAKELSVRFGYPMGNDAVFTIKRRIDSKGITLKMFASFVQQKYREIYEEADKYKIWGHGIEDLVLETIVVMPEEVILGIGS